MINLPNITLIGITSIRLDQTIKALEYSCRGITFGKVKLVSDVKPLMLPVGIRHEFCPKMSNIDEWNYAAIYELPKHVDTDFAILIHDNGFVVNPQAWRPEFLDYDFIGAPFPLPTDNFSYRDVYGNIIRVGNSVSLRSKKLLDLPIKENFEWKSFFGYTNEDGFICAHYRHKYEEAGCKFAPIEVAKYFSHEQPIPETQGIEPFMFHNYIGPNARFPRF